MDDDSFNDLVEALHRATDPVKLADELVASLNDLSKHYDKLSGNKLIVRRMMKSVIESVSQNSLDVLTAAAQCVVRDVNDDSDAFVGPEVEALLAKLCHTLLDEIAKESVKKTIQDIVLEMTRKNEKPNANNDVFPTQLVANAVKKWTMN